MMSHDQELSRDAGNRDSTNAFLGFMVDWSRFAGSLWDSLLTANVSPEALAERIYTYQVAVVDFLDNTFEGSWLEGTSPRRHEYIKLSFTNVRLMAQRANMMSLQFDSTTALLCASLAQNPLVYLQAFEANVEYPIARSRVLWLHAIPPLAVSLLMLCSLLVSDLGSIRVGPLDSWVARLQQSFDATINLLNDRAQDTILARRVLRDFERIIPVVQAILSKWSTEIILLQSAPEWSLVQDLIPPNVTELLPYREQLPDIRYSKLDEGLRAINGGHLETNRGIHTWDESHGFRSASSSVLWI
jgi:hypothetical protein